MDGSPLAHRGFHLTENRPWEDALPPDFSDLVGIAYHEWEPGRVSISLDMRPYHLNRNGVGHGGLILTLLDVTCGMAGNCRGEGLPSRKCVTISLTTNFIASLKSGVRIRGEGVVDRSRRTIFFSTGRLFDEEGALLASATGIYRYLD